MKYPKSKPYGMKDGGRVNPHMLGTGGAAMAGIALARRPQQIATAIDDDAINPPIVTSRLGIGGGLSSRRDGAVPPADMLNRQRRGMRDGGGIGEYWAQDNRQFEATKPSVLSRVGRSLNPLTGFGSALGSMHTAAGNGDKAGMALSAVEAIPLFGALKTVAVAGKGLAKQGTRQVVDYGRSAALTGATVGVGLINDAYGNNQAGMAGGGRIKHQPNGGRVTGPGGPTADKAGTYKYSDGEYILPADTTAAIGIGKLDALRDATHTFVDPSKRGMANGGSVEEKRRMVRAGGSEIVQGMRPETRNNVELARLQKPVMQSIGEGIGGIGGAAARGIGTVARNVEDTRKATLSIANNLPGAIAAPIATAASGFGAAVRTGYTGQPQTGTEYVGKPLFGDAAPSAVAAPVAVKPAVTQPVQPVQQANPVARQVTTQTIAKPQAPVSAPPATDKFGIGSFLASSNRADGKQNVFAGEGSTGKYSVNPADFTAATARAAKDKASLTSLAVSNINGTGEGLDRAYRLAAGDPEATAAVEAAIKQQKLRIDSANGSKEAGDLARQQGINETNLGIANIGAKSDQARLGIARGAQDLQQKQFESSDAVNKIGIKTSQAKLKDIEQATALRNQILAMPDDDPKRAGLVKKYNLLSGKDDGLSQKDLLDAFVQDSKARAANNELSQDFGAFSRNITGQGGNGAITPRAEYDKLPSGATYTGPDGKQYKKG